MYKINKIAKTIFLLSLSGVSGFIGSYSPEIYSPRSDSTTTTTSPHSTQEIRQLTERIEQLTEIIKQLERRTTTEPITAPEVVLAGDEAPVVTARGVAGELSSAAMSAATTIVMAAARGIAITLVSTGSELSKLELKQTKGAARGVAGAALEAGTKLLTKGKEAVIVIGGQILEAVRATAIKAGSAVVARIRTAPAQA